MTTFSSWSKPQKGCSLFLAQQVPNLWHGNPVLDGVAIEMWAEEAKKDAENLDVLSRSRELARIDRVLKCLYNEQANISSKVIEEVKAAKTDAERAEIADRYVRDMFEKQLNENISKRAQALAEQAKKEEGWMTYLFFKLLSPVYTRQEIDASKANFYSMSPPQRREIIQMIRDVWNSPKIAELQRLLTLLGLGFSAYKLWKLLNQQQVLHIELKTNDDAASIDAATRALSTFNKVMQTDHALLQKPNKQRIHSSKGNYVRFTEDWEIDIFEMLNLILYPVRSSNIIHALVSAGIPKDTFRTDWNMTNGVDLRINIKDKKDKEQMNQMAPEPITVAQKPIKKQPTKRKSNRK